MSANSDRIIELFSQATLKQSWDEREQFLATACRDEPELRAQVESLLQAHDAAGGYLNNTLALPTSEPLTEKSGSLIGRYKLLQKIGEGGCGVVYLAQQEELVCRQVALKIIKLGMDTCSVIARFEAERQALALMDHPNIAKVFDAGATETGRPYFVMELVRGIRITDYCDQHNLSTAERLDLFVQVCHAIQHAHQKGIIHRDVKPSNILVTVHDEVLVPKVIDFGIAKAVGPRLTEESIATEVGALIGTLEYMSPEQAGLDPADIDTRSDIYALGILLYELLTGTTPIHRQTLKKVAWDEVLRLIREKEPSKPSTRLMEEVAAASTTASPSKSPIVNRKSKIPPDLDWIVMKALEKNRARRYASASELAADIARHFNDEPVVARPPSAVYRLQKFVRKHKGPVAATAAIMGTIVLLGSLSLWLGARAQQQAKRVRANSILLSAAAAQDPLLKAQLLLETAVSPEWPGAVSVALQAAEDPLPIAVFRGHQYTVKCAAISPDGQRIVTGSRDSTARLWRVDGTEEPQVWPHANGVFCVAFSPDGSHVATGTGTAAANSGTTNVADAHLAYVWRVDGVGQPVLLRGHEDRVASVAFSPDGSHIVTGSEDGTARVWRSDGGGEQVVLRGHEGKVRNAVFSPDGTRVVTVSDDRTARVWRTDGSGEPVVLRGHVGRVNTAAFSPDNSRVVTASADSTARIWRADGAGEATVLTMADSETRSGGMTSAFFSWDGERIFATTRRSAWVCQADGTREFDMLEGMGGEVSRVVFSPDGSRAAAAVVGGASVAWGGRRPRPVARGHDRPISILAFSADNTRLVTVSDDSIRVWQVDRKTEPVILGVAGHKRGDTCFAFSPDGMRTVMASDDWTARVWRSDGMGEPIILRGHEGPVQSVAFNPDGARVVTSSDDRTVRFWHADGTGDPTIRRHDSEETWSWTALSADGARLLACSKDKTLQAWRLDGTETPVTLPRPAPQFSPCRGAFSPDGQRVAVADLDGSACVWRVDGSGEPVVFRGHLDEVLSVAFSPDGQRVVSTSTDGTARIWRAGDARELVVLRGHEGWVTCAAFSPDGVYVVTGVAGGQFYGTIRVWRADGLGEPLILHAHDNVSRLAFSPDGTRVAAGLENGTVRLWQITWPALLAHLRANVRVPLAPEQRMKLLGEGAAEAWANYAEWERRLGHKPQVKPR